MSYGNTILYIQAGREVEVRQRDVKLRDLLTMECSRRELLPHLEEITVFHFKENDNTRTIVSVLRLIECIHGLFPELQIQNLGETDIIVTYEKEKERPMIWHIVKSCFVTAVTFCGASFSIMSFHNDIALTRLFSQIYTLVTGQTSDGFTVLEISYSIGLTAGILIFFNHFGKKRLTADPTPMEIQMRLYEKDIQTTLIENAGRKGEEINVDAADTPGVHRS